MASDASQSDVMKRVRVIRAAALLLTTRLSTSMMLLAAIDAAAAIGTAVSPQLSK